MNQKFLLQSNSKQKNSQFITLEGSKRQVSKRKSHFFQENVLSKSKAPKNKEKLSPTFNKIQSTLEKTPREFITPKSSKQSNLKYGNIKIIFTEHSSKSQRYVQTLKTEKDNDILKQTTASKVKNNLNFIRKKQHEQPLSLDTSKRVQTVAHNFVSSFRVIFKELIDAYFLRIFLKKKLIHIRTEIWIYLLLNSDLQLMSDQKILNQKQIESKKFITSIHKLLGKQFTLCEVQNMFRNYFPQKNNILYEDFENLLYSENDLDFMCERFYAEKYNSLGPRMLANEFFITLIGLTDLQKKLRMICCANENELNKLVLEKISSGPMIAIDKLWAFLDADNYQCSSRMKLTKAKVFMFIGKMLNKKHQQSEFIKWLKQDDELLI